MLVAAGVGALAGAPPERLRARAGRHDRPPHRLRAAPPRPLRPQSAGARLRLPAGQARPLSGAAAPARWPGGGLLPVDFRRCRQASCARPGPRPGLTASGRRVTALHLGRGPPPLAAGRSRVTYWLYRPDARLGAVVRDAPAPAEIAAASAIRLNLEDDPALVPLETLPGRNHHRFPPRRGAALALACPVRATRAEPAASPSRPRRSRRAPRLLALAVLVGLLAGVADQAAPVGGAEDEGEREEAEQRRPDGDRDLLADRVGEHRDRPRARSGSRPAAPAGRRRRPA